MESDKEAIKQAIREVLLSDEFLTAFAAAWQKTPILHESEVNLGPKFFVCEPADVSEEVRRYSNEVKKYEQ